MHWADHIQSGKHTCTCNSNCTVAEVPWTSRPSKDDCILLTSLVSLGLTFLRILLLWPLRRGSLSSQDWMTLKIVSQSIHNYNTVDQLASRTDAHGHWRRVDRQCSNVMSVLMWIQAACRCINICRKVNAIKLWMTNVNLLHWQDWTSRFESS